MFRLRLILVMALLATSLLVAQQRTTPGSFRVDVEEVVVRVTVSDPRDRYVAGLEREHFRIFEDKVEQAIMNFSNEPGEVSVAIVLDTSDSMSDNILTARTSIVRFLDQGHSEDEYALITFNDRTTLMQDFTNRGREIQNQVTLANPHGRTALYDAVYLGVERMRAARHRKKALIIITDGEDNSSRYTFSEVKQLVRESDVQIYVIGERGEMGYGRGLINNLVGLTGGRAFYPRSFKQLDYYIDLIHQELRNQYVLTFVPSNSATNGTWRKLRIDLNPPEGFPVRLRALARDGYFGPGSSQ